MQRAQRFQIDILQFDDAAVEAAAGCFGLCRQREHPHERHFCSWLGAGCGRVFEGPSTKNQFWSSEKLFKFAAHVRAFDVGHCEY